MREDNMESFYDWFDELSQCEIIFSNDDEKLINYLQKNNKLYVILMIWN